MMNLAPSITGCWCDSFPQTPQGNNRQNIAILLGPIGLQGVCVCVWVIKNIRLVVFTQNKQLEPTAHHRTKEGSDATQKKLRTRGRMSVWHPSVIPVSPLHNRSRRGSPACATAWLTDDGHHSQQHTRHNAPGTKPQTQITVPFFLREI